MINYTIQEANELTLMLRQLALLKTNHPILASRIDDVTEELTSLREFVLSLIEEQS